MRKSTKQTLLGGVAVVCLLILAPACIESYPLVSAMFIAVAAMCIHYGELWEVKDND